MNPLPTQAVEIFFFFSGVTNVPQALKRKYRQDIVVGALWRAHTCTLCPPFSFEMHANGDAATQAIAQPTMTFERYCSIQSLRLPLAGVENKGTIADGSGTSLDERKNVVVCE